MNCFTKVDGKEHEVWVIQIFGLHCGREKDHVAALTSDNGSNGKISSNLFSSI